MNPADLCHHLSEHAMDGLNGGVSEKGGMNVGSEQAIVDHEADIGNDHCPCFSGLICVDCYEMYE